MTQADQATSTQLEYARGDDRYPMLYATIDPSPVLYRWYNGDANSRGITELACSLRDGQLFVQAVAAGPDGPIDWGEVPATLHFDMTITGAGRDTVEPVRDGVPTVHYADTTTTAVGPCFTATFDHGFQKVYIQARINLGLLVVAIFNQFTDDSGRNSYFVRDVYYR